MIFKIFLNCFFPSFNSKIETWVICGHTTHKHTHQQAQPNTQTHPPKTKTLITHKHTTHNPQTHNTQTLFWLYNRTPKKKKNCYECRRVRHKGAQYVDSQI